MNAHMKGAAAIVIALAAAACSSAPRHIAAPSSAAPSAQQASVPCIDTAQVVADGRIVSADITQGQEATKRYDAQGAAAAALATSQDLLTMAKDAMGIPATSAALAQASADYADAARLLDTGHIGAAGDAISRAAHHIDAGTAAVHAAEADGTAVAC
jgi:hypothetical protein